MADAIKLKDPASQRRIRSRRPSDIMAELTYVVGVLAAVLLVHNFTGRQGHSFPLGSAETTFAAAVAVGLLAPLVGIRMIQRGSAASGSQGTIMAVAGTSIMFLALIPAICVAHDVSTAKIRAKASFDGYLAATQVGILSEKRPKDAKNIGILFGMELLQEGYKDFRDLESREQSQREIDDRRRELGLEKSRDEVGRNGRVYRSF